MTSRRRAVGAVLCAAVLLLAACGDGGDDDDRARADTTVEDETTGDDTEATEPTLAPPGPEVFAIEDPDVAAAAPDPLLVPPEDAPGDLAVVDLTLPEGDPPAGPPEGGRGAQTLWVDPDDPSRALVVARTERSDTGGAFGVDGDPVDVAGTEGTISDDGGLVVVAYPFEIDLDECDCTQAGVVAARGFTRDEVLAVAEVADPMAERPAVAADSLPDGLESLGTAPILDPFEDTRDRAEVFTVDGEAQGGLLIATQGDARLAHHLGFWIDEGRHRGLFDSPAALVENGEAVVVVLGGEGAVALATALVPGTRDEALAAAGVADDERLGGPPEPEDDCLGDDVDEETRVLRTDSEDEGLRWTIGAGVADGELETCIRTTDADGGGLSSAFTGLTTDADPDQVQVAAVASGRWILVLGHVPAEAVEVDLAVTGAEPLVVPVEETGPSDDRRWFLAVVLSTAEEATVTATALDASGSELAVGETVR